MVYEMYKIVDGEEDTGIYAILQTITMEVKRIATRPRMEAWMDEQGLIEENGWNLDDAFEIDVETYNNFCIL